MESTIQTYTNKKGVSHDAYFNARGKYMGSVKKLGPVQCIVIAVPVQDLELENKQLREEVARLREQLSKLYVNNE